MNERPTIGLNRLWRFSPDPHRDGESLGFWKADRDFPLWREVAVPCCQGKGLGKAALSFAMNRLAEWHDRCYLVTSTERIAAIKLYLSFGFEPDMTPANARAAWSELNGRHRHPALNRARVDNRRSSE